MNLMAKEHVDSCVFCREQNGSADTNFARIYPELDNRTLLESENLTIFPCIGQLAPKHSLIATKRHFNTFAQVFNVDSIMTEEVSSLISEFKRLHVNGAEKLLIFEHGAVCSDDGGCGIYHAHIHLVPVVDDVSIESLYKFSGKSHYLLSDCYANVDSNSSYVMAGYFDGQLFLNARDEPLTSQYLRKKLANQLDVEEWNWQNYQSQNSVNVMLKNRF